MRLFIISHIEPTADLTMSFTLFLFFHRKFGLLHSKHPPHEYKRMYGTMMNATDKD